MAKDSEPEAAPEARIDHFLTVKYDTVTYGPPHTVTVRSCLSGWEDHPMTALESGDHAIWSADLKAEPDQGSIIVEFKLVLDGEHWMSGENRSGTLEAPPAVLHFDDSTVTWET